MTPNELTEGDVVRWKWKEGREPIIGCYAKLGIVHGRKLRDIYWSDWKHTSYLEPERIEVSEYLGNLEDYRQCLPADLLYYDPADVIDLRHANDMLGTVYIKLGARKSKARMKGHAEQMLQEAEREKASAERAVERFKRILADLDAIEGEPDGIWF